jgi:hypothetical protein
MDIRKVLAASFGQNRVACRSADDGDDDLPISISSIYSNYINNYKPAPHHPLNHLSTSVNRYVQGGCSKISPVVDPRSLKSAAYTLTTSSVEKQRISRTNHVGKSSNNLDNVQHRRLTIKVSFVAFVDFLATSLDRRTRQRASRRSLPSPAEKNHLLTYLGLSPHVI